MPLFFHCLSTEIHSEAVVSTIKVCSNEKYKKYLSFPPTKHGKAGESSLFSDHLFHLCRLPVIALALKCSDLALHSLGKMAHCVLHKGEQDLKEYEIFLEMNTYKIDLWLFLWLWPSVKQLAGGTRQ